MEQQSRLAFPSTIEHPADARNDGDLHRQVRDHYASHPGVRFLVDVMAAIHAGPDAIRNPNMFYSRFPARSVMSAFERRPDLRARIVQAATGGPPSLLRRLAPDDLAAQIELLVAEDMPPEECLVRAEEDRSLSVFELYLKYIDGIDLCAYLPAADLWSYESSDGWWERVSPSSRRMIAAEIRSIRTHQILSDAEILDCITNEVFERELPNTVRAEIRLASRRAAAEGRAFTDTDLVDAIRTSDGSRDVFDELARCISLPHLRRVVDAATHVLGLARPESTPVAQTVDAQSLARPTQPAPANAGVSGSLSRPPLTSRPPPPPLRAPSQRISGGPRILATPVAADVTVDASVIVDERISGVTTIAAVPDSNIASGQSDAAGRSRKRTNGFA